MRVSIQLQHVALRDIVANRYRNIDRYRISESKIDALIQSFDNSGFWDGSIQARPHPTKTDKFEIAFGHHRIEAAKRAKFQSVGLVVAQRSDADMLRMMADENREEFKGDHLVAIETVGATIEAFGRGEIELDPVDPKTPKSAVYVAEGSATYTCATVARFLGWVNRHGKAEPQPTNAVRLAFDAYHEKTNIGDELAKLPEDDRSRQATSTVLRAVRSARVIARRANKSEHEVDAAAKRAAKEAVKQIKDGGIASKVRDEATKIGRAAAQVERSPIEISQFVRQRIDGLKTRVINLETEADGVLNDVLPYRDQMDEAAERFLIDGLRFADERLRGLFSKWLARFSTQPLRNVTPQRKRLKG